MCITRHYILKSCILFVFFLQTVHRQGALPFCCGYCQQGHGWNMRDVLGNTERSQPLSILLTFLEHFFSDPLANFQRRSVKLVLKSSIDAFLSSYFLACMLAMQVVFLFIYNQCHLATTEGEPPHATTMYSWINQSVMLILFIRCPPDLIEGNK